MIRIESLDMCMKRIQARLDRWRDTLFESFRRNRGTDYRTRKSDAGGDASTPAGHIKQYITDFIFHEQQTWTTVKQKLKV